MATSAEEVWQAFTKESGLKDAHYQTRWFGDQSNTSEVQRYADEVLAGTKTATSTPLDTYTSEQVAIPQVGDYNVLLDGEMHPVAVIKTVVSELIPFYRVSAEHAYHEAEGDRSLQDWRKRKETEFSPALEKSGQNLTPDTPLVTEVFEVVYRVK